MNKLHLELILKTRHIRKDLLGSKWINEYIDEVKKQLEVEELNCIVTNSMERKISLTSVQNSHYLLFDNYFIELFDYIDYLFNNRHLRENGLRKLLYKILAENYYLDDCLNTSFFMFEKYNKINISYSAISQSEECLFCQQAFLFFHEIEHYLIDQNKVQIYNDDVALDLLMKQIKEERLYNDINNFLNNKNSIEEMSCDITAANISIALTYDKYHTAPTILAKYVFMAHFNMFLISIIDSQSKFRIKDEETFDFFEYYIRILNLIIFLPEIIETTYGESSINVVKIIKELEESYMDMCDYIVTIQDKEFIKLMCLNLEVDKYLPEQYRKILKDKLI